MAVSAPGGAASACACACSHPPAPRSLPVLACLTSLPSPLSPLPSPLSPLPFPFPMKLRQPFEVTL